MAKQRFIKTTYWKDEWIMTLNANEKYLYMYLLTNESTTLCGIYHQPIPHIALETQLSEKVISDCLIKFEKDRKMIYKNGWIVMLNHRKHQSFSPMISRGIERELKEIPQEIAKLAYPIDRVPTPKRVLSPSPKSKLESKSISTIKAFKKEDVEYSLSSLLFEKIVENNPTHKFTRFNEKEKENQIQKFAIDADLLIRRDKQDPQGIKIIIEWCQNNNFWKPNIQSMAKFREKFDTLVAQARSQIANNQTSEIPTI